MSNLTSDLYYKHSGRMGFALPLLVMIGLPVIVALSAAYSYIVVFCPVVGYVNVLFLGGFVFAAGVSMAFLARIGRCRSNLLLTLFGLFAGLVALYFSWVFFIKALFGDEVSVLSVALSPLGVWQVGAAINADGWWGPSGIAQWALVAIEAVVIVGGVFLFTTSAIEREVFCETCGQWCEPFETMHLRMTDEIDNTKVDDLNHLELLALEESEADEYPRLDAEVLQCEECKTMKAIRFKKMTQVMDDGELKENAEDISGILVQKS